MKNQAEIERHLKDIAFDESRIKLYEQELEKARINIKWWRISKMIDELFLWYDTKGKFEKYELYHRQFEFLMKLKENL